MLRLSARTIRADLFFASPQSLLAQQSVSLAGTIYSGGDKRRPVQQASLLASARSSRQYARTDVRRRILAIMSSVSFATPRQAFLRSLPPAISRSDLHVDLSFASDRGVSIYLNPNPGDLRTSSPAGSVSAHEMSMPQKARDLLSSGEKNYTLTRTRRQVLRIFSKPSQSRRVFTEAYYQIGMAYLTLRTRDEAEKELPQIHRSEQR